MSNTRYTILYHLKTVGLEFENQNGTWKATAAVGYRIVIISYSTIAKLRVRVVPTTRLLCTTPVLYHEEMPRNDSAVKVFEFLHLGQRYLGTSCTRDQRSLNQSRVWSLACIRFTFARGTRYRCYMAKFENLAFRIGTGIQLQQGT